MGGRERRKGRGVEGKREMEEGRERGREGGREGEREGGGRERSGVEEGETCSDFTHIGSEGVIPEDGGLSWWLLSHMNYHYHRQ